ncbi:glycerophosphodiester phosphodiesterase [Caenispirillum salinarum]|nr:glycerophosphodiester phosphodiesterase [Caenispirillum salinarum]
MGIRLRMARLALAAALAAVPAAGALAAEALVIAHRGASGMLPEHTLAAKAAAHALGADCIEQDVVLTADGVPIVLHDIHLDTTTDVAAVFPDRARDDGRYYAADFTLAEVRRLSVTERRDLETGAAAFPGRFPVGQARFFVPTLAEELQLIQGMDAATGRTTCVYPEIKAPAFHRAEGLDVSAATLAVLRDHGYADDGDPVFLQTFDFQELNRLRRDLGWQGRLVQLIGENRWGIAPGTDFDHLRTPAGLAEVAQVADGIGPWIRHVATGAGVTPLVADAHAAGLVVHAYTLRADRLPPGVPDLAALVRLLVLEAGVDGLFTDFPGRTRAALEALPDTE